MNRILAPVAVLLAMTLLPGCTRAQAVAGSVAGPLSKVVPFWDHDPPEEPLPRVVDVPRDLREGFANPSFEQMRNAFHPADWGRAWDGIILLRPGEAFDGSRYARVSRRHFYFQEFALTLPPWQTITVSVMGRGELEIEKPRLNVFTMTSGRQFVMDQTTVRDEPLTREWGPFYGTFTRQGFREDEAETRISIMSSSQADWIDIDDAAILFEHIANGGFEDPSQTGDERGAWSLSSGARLTDTEMALAGNRSLHLPPGGEARQLVAHTPHVATYFIAGQSSGPFLLEETRLTNWGAAADGTTSHTVTVPLSGRFAVELPPSPDAHAARVLLKNTQDQDVYIDELSRGWVSVWPASFAPVENSASPVVRLSAAWQGRLDSAQIVIEDSEGIPAAIPSEIHREEGTIWTEFDGAELPAGDYTALFQLSGTGGEHLNIRRPFRLERPDPFPDSTQPLETDQFVRMPWIWLYPFTDEMEFETVDEAEIPIRHAMEDGFNLLLLIISKDQYPLVKEAADRVGVPYVLYNPDWSPSIRVTPGHMTWDPSGFFEHMEALEVFKGSPLFQGIYIYDEPNVVPALVPRTEQIARMLDVHPELPRGYSFMNPFRSVEDLDFPVLSSFYYPVRRWPQDREETFFPYVETTEEHIAEAIRTGRPFWGGTQGYGSVVADPVMSPAQASAQLGLNVAMGASGYFVFLYSSLNPHSGLRGMDWSEGPRLSAYRKFNERIEELWPLLRDLPPEREKPEVEENVIARMVQGDDGDYRAFVTNYDDKRTVEVVIATSYETAMENIETGEVSDPDMRHTALLPPGEWAVLRFSGGVRPWSFLGVFEEAGGEPEPLVEELHRFTMGERLQDIALNPTTGTIAAIANQSVRVYTFDGEELHNEYVALIPGQLRYLDNDVFFAGSRTWGMRFYRHQLGGIVMTEERARHTGGSFDVLPVEQEGVFWNAMGFRGVSLVDTAAGYEFLERIPSENSDYFSLHGPYRDGSIIALEHVFGLHRIVEGEEELESERLSSTRVYTRSVASPAGRRIATGTLDRGVTVLDVDRDGRPLNTIRVLDPELIQAEGTAWLNEDTLAVVDLKRGVRFYRILSSGEWSFLGHWNPAPKPFLIDAIASLPGEGLLAVALYDGEVVIADVRQVIDAERDPNAWILH